MAIEIFDAVIYFPIIVICMVIGQIYFEHYFSTFKDQHSVSLALTAVIIVTYFIQELCLLQISLYNIRDATFIMVLPVTMLFHNARNKTWWWLLTVTPTLANIYTVLIGRATFRYWWVWVVESAVFALVCLVLIKNRTFSRWVRYTMALPVSGSSN